MIITCEKCSVNFNLDESLLKPTGSKVRCSKCKHVFTAYPPAPEKESFPEKIDISDMEQEGDTGEETEFDESEFEDFEDSDLAEEADEVEEEQDDEFDVSGLEKILDADEDSEPEDSGPGIEAKGDEEVNVAALEEILGTDSGLEEETETMDQELDFDIDDEVSAESDEEPEEPDLDIDPDEFLEEENEDLDYDLDIEPGKFQEEENEDLDHDLDIEPGKFPEEENEELDLDIDLEPDEPAEAESEDLDLEPDEVFGSEEDAESTSEDINLDFELDGDEKGDAEPDVIEPDVVEPDVVEYDVIGKEEEIDLAELEKTLEIDLLSPGSEEEDEPEDVELELGADEPQEDSEDDEDVDQDGEFDLSDIEEILDMDEGADAETNTEDLELEFVGGDIDGANTDTDTDTDTPDTGEIETTLGFEDGEVETADETPGQVTSEKKTLSKIFIALLLIILLSGVALCICFLLDSKGIKIPFYSDLGIRVPYISDLLEVETKVEFDISKLQPIQATIKGDFVENSETGQLYIITGKVKNESAETRRTIRISAKLYAKGGTLKKTVTSICGNILSDIEITSMDMASINKQLMSQPTADYKNISVKPGGTLPFMIAISNLPDDLDSFNIEIDGSLPE